MSSSPSARKRAPNQTPNQIDRRAKRLEKASTKSVLAAEKAKMLKTARRIVRKNPLSKRDEVEDSASQVAVVRQYLYPEELRAFYRAVPETAFDYWHPYFFLQYFYGCRISEPALILEEDISFKKRIIVVRRLKKAQEKEGYHEHLYKMDTCVVDAVRRIQAWKARKKVEDNPFLFPSNRHRTTEQVGAERLSQLRNLGGYQAVSRFSAHRMFERVAALAKLPEHLQHSQVLRDTRAVFALASGMPPEQVQVLLGHSSFKMTQRHILAAQEARAKCGDVFGVLGTGLGL
jgi:integrase